jgi:hypothetical protein
MYAQMFASFAEIAIYGKQARDFISQRLPSS